MDWVNRIAILPNLKMQHGSFSATATELCDHLPGFHILPFLHQNLPVVSVSTQIVLVMIHDNQIAVSKQPVAGVDYIPGGCCSYSIPGLAGNINTFIDFPGC